MPAAKERKGQPRYPIGIPLRVARKNKNSGHGRDHKYGRRFYTIACPACRVEVRCGLKPPTICGACRQPYPKNGYTNAANGA